jgi:hypothetical protein
MSNENRSAIIKKMALRNGLLIGAISIALTLVLWIVNPLMQYTNTGVSLGLAVLVIVLFVVFGLEIRKALGGYWTFGEAFKGLFIMSLYVSILTIVFHYILFNFIDPTLAQRASEAVIAKLTESLNNAGVGQDKIDEYSKSIPEKFAATGKNEAINLGVGLIIYAVVDLIIAAIIKKNPPLQPIIDETDPTV